MPRTGRTVGGSGDAPALEALIAGDGERMGGLPSGTHTILRTDVPGGSIGWPPATPEVAGTWATGGNAKWVRSESRGRSRCSWSGSRTSRPAAASWQSSRGSRKRGLIRLIDVLFVQKDKQGNIANQMHMTDLGESERLRLGEIAGALIGLRAGGTADAAQEGAELGALAVAERDAGLSVDRLGELGDSIPNDSAAAIVVIEHHWATGLRDSVAEAGGHTLMQAMITADAVALVGDELRARVEAEEAIEVLEAVKLSAAIEIAQTLAEAELIEEAAISEAADVVATALAIEDAAAQDVADTLLAADLIEEAAVEDAQRVVSEALDVEAAAGAPA